MGDPGIKRWGRISVELEGVPPMEFSALVPHLDTVNIASDQVARIGGPNRRDEQARVPLYFLIGAITVAGGHIEAAMKRLAILTRGSADGSFSTIDWDWTSLHAELRQQADTVGPPNDTLAHALDWAEEHQIKRKRDDVVHACWWDYADIPVTRGRFNRKSDGHNIVGTMDELKTTAEECATYAAMLEDVVGQSWLNVYLPRDLADQLSIIEGSDLAG